MDRYIKILLIKLYNKYKVSIISIMTNNNKNKISTTYKLIIKGKTGKKKDKLLLTTDLYSKRDLVLELIKWDN